MKEDLKEKKVQLDQLVLEVLLEIEDHRGKSVLKEIKEMQVQLDPKAPQVKETSGRSRASGGCGSGWSTWTSRFSWRRWP